MSVVDTFYVVLYLELAADTSTVVENKKLQRGERRRTRAVEQSLSVIPMKLKRMSRCRPRVFL